MGNHNIFLFFVIQRKTNLRLHHLPHNGIARIHKLRLERVNRLQQVTFPFLHEISIWEKESQVPEFRALTFFIILAGEEGGGQLGRSHSPDLGLVATEEKELLFQDWRKGTRRGGCNIEEEKGANDFLGLGTIRLGWLGFFSGWGFRKRHLWGCGWWAPSVAVAGGKWALIPFCVPSKVVFVEAFRPVVLPVLCEPGRFSSSDAPKPHWLIWSNFGFLILPTTAWAWWPNPLKTAPSPHSALAFKVWSLERKESKRGCLKPDGVKVKCIYKSPVRPTLNAFLFSSFSFANGEIRTQRPRRYLQMLQRISEIKGRFFFFEILTSPIHQQRVKTYENERKIEKYKKKTVKAVLLSLKTQFGLSSPSLFQVKF